MHLPASVQICEVGPRDGFQIEPEFIATEAKIAIVDRVSASAVPRIQVTSFVSPKAIPQLRDAEEVIAGIRRRPGTVSTRRSCRTNGGAAGARRGRRRARYGALRQRQPQPRQCQHADD